MTSCKHVFGTTVCKMRSGLIQIPSASRGAIPLRIYTAKECTVCKDVTEIAKKANKSAGGIFGIEILDVDKVPTLNAVISLPTMIVGNRPVIGKYVTEENILTAAVDAFRQRI
jgi:hypothetical protein